MITITKKEESVLNKIKESINNYPEGIPEEIIREELGFYEFELKELLNHLSSFNLLSFDNNVIQIKNPNMEYVVVDSREEAKNIELGQKEKDSLEIIKELVDEDNLVSRYILEGTLLYGDLNLSDFRMYHILLSLENKKIIKPIKKEDGDYFKLL